MKNYIKQGRVSSQELELIRKDVSNYRERAFVSTVGYGDNVPHVSDTRVSHVYFPKPGEFFNTFNILQSVIIQEYLGVSFNITEIAEIQYVRYNAGGYFNWHKDNVNTSREKDRGLTFSINISDEKEYEGGELLVRRLDNSIVTLSKQPGSYIVFPAFLKHKANKVISGTREAVVVWTHITNVELEQMRAQIA